MNLLKQIEQWGDTHHPKWIDFIRIVLGFILMAKGVQFINHMNELTAMMEKSRFITTASVTIVSHYVVFAHLIGGALMSFGLLTRLAALVQIPILAGALMFVNLAGGLFEPHTEFWFSLLIMLLLVFYLIEGSGPISIDEWMRKNPDERPHKHKWG